SNAVYVRVDFRASNTGQTPATHFTMETELYWRVSDETGEGMDLKMIEQVEKWKRECKPDAFANLLPNDEELSSIWASYTAEEVKWHQFGVETAARPMLLAAAFYRTVSDPDKVQVSWRSWYLNPLD